MNDPCFQHGKPLAITADNATNNEGLLSELCPNLNHAAAIDVKSATDAMDPSRLKNALLVLEICRQPMTENPSVDFEFQDSDILLPLHLV
jgi:hypothetical protein